jgi:hypothetical protein
VDGLSTHHRSGRRATAAGGRKRTPGTRAVKLVHMSTEDDTRDLHALCEAWGVPLSTLLWAVVHDWLQRSRCVAADLGEARGALRMCLEVALRDRELGPWLRRETGQTQRG